MAETTYVIKARPPLRAFAIAAVASLVGAVWLVLALTNQWPILSMVVACCVLGFGLFMVVAGLAAVQRQTVTLTLGDDGYRLEGASGEEGGDWDAVTRVTLAKDRSLVTIHEGDTVRHHLVFRSASTTQLDEILADIGQRLDEANGYTPL